MYLLKFFHSISKPNSVKLVTQNILKNVQQNFVKREFTVQQSDIKARMQNDVVLFKLEKPRFFLCINFFSGIQCLTFSYLGYFLYKSLKNATDEKKQKFWQSFLSDRKMSFGLSAVAFIFGVVLFMGTLFYTARSIRKIILHKGGRNLSIITYKLPFVKNKYRVPVSSVSAYEHRTDAKKFLSLKLKDKSFFFLIDIRGEFLEPDLFDYTAGIRRNF